MRLLLISNSTNPGEPYLDHPKEMIRQFLGSKPVDALFIPYAAVTFSYDEYEKKVQEGFLRAGHKITSVHRYDDPISAVNEATAIVVGGGNTWKLLKTIRDNGLTDIIRKKVIGGIPYIGWSAGANISCPTIKTTNDMPVVEPDSFDSLNLIPFQINPHYTDANPDNHAGETREQRIEEFIEVNPGIYVAGLREGTMLIYEEGVIKLHGKKRMRIFKKGIQPSEYSSSDDLSFLMQ